MSIIFFSFRVGFIVGLFLSVCVCVCLWIGTESIVVDLLWPIGGGRNKPNKQKSGIDERRHGVVKGSKRCIQLLSENKQV